jgi:hypothetical protein
MFLCHAVEERHPEKRKLDTGLRRYDKIKDDCHGAQGSPRNDKL